MPEEGISLLQHKDILSFEEIIEFVKVAVDSGIDKVRITGGEPLVRKNIVEFIGNVAKINGIKDLSLTTNGILLEQYAQPLFDAGLHRINISLDSIDSERFFSITRGGDLKKVFAGIEAAKAAGLSPIKINCVIHQNSQEPDAIAIKEYCLQQGLEARFIRQMELHRGVFSTVEGGSGGNCSICNRLRLTANGKLKPCLFNDIEFDIRELGYSEAIRKAIHQKPQCGTHNHNNAFHNIGG